MQGTQVAYGQAHRPQSNGRAETAGKALDNVIRKVAAAEKICWLEILPRALAIYNDTPGESGMSPHKIVFGRDRINSGLPLPVPREAEDIVAFVDRMKRADAAIRDRLSDLHRAREKGANRDRQGKLFFRKGDRCWVLKPPSSEKEQAIYHGPCEIARVDGPTSYHVRIGEGHARDCSVEQLKPYYPPLIGKPWPLYYTRHDLGANPADPDEWVSDKIIAHRKQDPSKKDGIPQWKTTWVGFPKSHATWEPASSFLPTFNSDWVAYNKKNAVEMDISRCFPK